MQVESEKSAIIASAIMQKYIWLETGSKSQLKAENLEVFKRRKVIAFPEVDVFEEQTTKLTAMEGLTITISNVLEKYATDRECYNHNDIADWLSRWREETIKQFGSLDSVPLPELEETNLGEMSSTCGKTQTQTYVREEYNMLKLFVNWHSNLIIDFISLNII